MLFALFDLPHSFLPEVEALHLVALQVGQDIIKALLDVIYYLMGGFAGEGYALFIQMVTTGGKQYLYILYETVYFSQAGSILLELCASFD